MQQIKFKLGYQEVLIPATEAVIKAIALLASAQPIRQHHSHDYRRICYTKQDEPTKFEFEIGSFALVDQVPEDFADPASRAATLALAEAAE